MILVMPLAGCETAAESERTHTKITPQQAQAMMAQSDINIIILDVRTQEEFRSGHIPGAILLPGDEILARAGYLIPDLDQIILVYCRSGARSNVAALALVELGYTAVYDFGGIMDWIGEVVRG